MTDLPDISEHFHNSEGFSRPDWSAIAACIEANVPEGDWEGAWESVSRIWLDRLSGELGGDYRVCQTPNFLIVIRAPEPVARNVGYSFEAALKRILSNLAGAASGENFGRHVVLMFAELSEYDRYVSFFFSDGEHPASGGVCLDGNGFVHFAIPALDYASYLSVLVHELTHGLLAHLPIPLWLNEAVAMRMEELLCGVGNVSLDEELCDRHAAHWNSGSIQEFWSGASWQIAGESFDLSYSLASLLWNKIETDIGATREQIIGFITSANAADGGEAAFRTTFKRSLADLAAGFLGAGEWGPLPEKWLEGEGAAATWGQLSFTRWS